VTIGAQKEHRFATQGLPDGLASSTFTAELIPASRHLPTTRHYVTLHGGRTSAGTVLADPVTTISHETLARMRTGAPSIALLDSGRLLVVHERRPPKHGSLKLPGEKRVCAHRMTLCAASLPEEPCVP
jgi:hypothetical protein